MLKAITTKVVPKINFVFFCEISPKKLVTLDLLSSLIIAVFLDKKFKVVGSNVNVIVKETISPSVIIHPKSIIGLMPLKIKDKKAQIVVKTVYKIGQNIFCTVCNMASLLLRFGKSFLN